MKKAKKKKRIGAIRLAKETTLLLGRCIGVLFVYLSIFELFNEIIFSPLRRKLWSLSLITVPDGYISDQNITQIFTHPAVTMAGLFTVIGVCLLTLWQISGMLLCLECAYQKKPIKFARIFPTSITQSAHILKPKNWLAFLYFMIILPIIDSSFSSDIISEITIPEFIMDYIESKTSLSIILFVVMVLMFWLFLRFMFLSHYMILERKDFGEAVKRSSGLLKKRNLRSYFQVTSSRLFGSLLFYLIPMLVLSGLKFALLKLMQDYAFANAIADNLFHGLFFPAAKEFGTVFIKMYTFAILVILFHYDMEDIQEENEIVIPEKCIKTEGKIRSFRGFLYAWASLGIIIIIALYCIMVLLSSYNTEIVEMLINSTQIAAHKGYSSKAPENTMEAFELAKMSDCIDYIEMDIRETRDGVPVVIHDASLFSATGEDILIYDVTYDELQKMTASYSFSKEKFADSRVPALEDVLKEYAGKKNFLIEIKADKRTPDLPEKIVRLMEKYDITKDSMIHSGNYESLRKVKECNPDIACGLIMAVSTGGYADLPYADFFSVEHTYLSTPMISQIHKRGKKVFVWTVNSADSFTQVAKMDVDMLISDYPESAYRSIHSNERELIAELNAVTDNNFEVPVPIFEDNDFNDYSTDYDSEGDD